MNMVVSNIQELKDLTDCLTRERQVELAQHLLARLGAETRDESGRDGQTKLPFKESEEEPPVSFEVKAWRAASLM